MDELESVKKNEDLTTKGSELDNFHKTNKRNKWKFLITGFLVIVAIAIGLYVGYNKLGSSPIIVYKNAINELYKNLNEGFKENKDFNISMNEPFTVEFNTSLDTNMEELKLLNNLNYNIKLGMDYPNKKASIGLGVNSSENIINVLASIIDNKAYLECKELFSKTIDLGDNSGTFEIDTDELEDLKLAKYDDMEYLLKEYKQILVDSLNPDKFSFEKDTLTIDDKEVKVKKVSYLLDEETLKNTFKTFTDRILEDDELLEKTAVAMDIDKNDLKDKLEDFKKDGYKIDYDEEMTLVLYADSFNQIVAGELSEKGENLRFTKIDDNHLNIVLTSYEDNGKIELDIEGSKKETTIDFNYDDGTDKFSGSFTISNIKITDEKVAADFKFSITGKMDGETIKVALAGDFSITKGDIEMVDTTDSVKSEDLTQKDLQEIQKNLEKLMGKLDLGSLFAGSL